MSLIVTALAGPAIALAGTPWTMLVIANCAILGGLWRAYRLGLLYDDTDEDDRAW